jgi:hypothetical protein
VAADFDLMSLPARTIELLRYGVVLVEYRIAPDGFVRAWASSTLRVLIFVMFPVIAIFILVTVLVPIFGDIAQICQSLEVAAHSLFMAVVWLILTVFLIAVLIALAGMRLLRG